MTITVDLMSSEWKLKKRIKFRKMSLGEIIDWSLLNLPKYIDVELGDWIQIEEGEDLVSSKLIYEIEYVIQEGEVYAEERDYRGD